MSVTIEKIVFPSHSEKAAGTADELNNDEENKEEISHVTIQTAYEQHLLEDGKGSATIASYTGDIKGFLQWMEEKKLSFDGNSPDYPSPATGSICRKVTIGSIPLTRRSTVCIASTIF